jgi:hypothetical protein
MTSPSLVFDSPAIFTVLAFVAALGAYLRSVSVGARDLSMRIRAGDLPGMWPCGPLGPIQPHTTKKLESLRSTVIAIQRLTPWLFGLMVAISARILLYAVTRANGLSSSPWLSAPYLAAGFDVVLCTIMPLLVAVMWWMHGNGKRREKDDDVALEAWRRSRVET